ncbi:unnamed protein product [Cyprideis torosa]|uniref:Uncharacterized protein n=1 Tax=Cyprideis torosa TaxID=163714 RepID=A0A7R8ZV61_9CRUS|nr:unnamed protein product [Cyprideis torosa]CAG0902393.1 unnamed protein product [Cyprideis torosa]
MHCCLTRWPHVAVSVGVATSVCCV